MIYWFTLYYSVAAHIKAADESRTALDQAASRASATAAFKVADKYCSGVLGLAGLETALAHLGVKPLPTPEDLGGIIESMGPDGVSMQTFINFCISGDILAKVI